MRASGYSGRLESEPVGKWTELEMKINSSTCFSLIFGAALLAGSAQACDFVTLSNVNDSILLARNEVAVLVSASMFSWDNPSWTLLQYQAGTDDPVSVALPLWAGPSEGLPLVGPGVIQFSPDLDGSSTGLGIIDFEIERQNNASRYVTFAHPDDCIRLARGEIAWVVATAYSSTPAPSWTMLQYQTGTNGPVPVTLPLFEDPNEALPLVGPAVIQFSPDIDEASTGPGIVGFKIEREDNGPRYVTFAHPDDHINLAKGETAFIVSTALISLDDPSWTMIQYQTGTNDPVSVALPLTDFINGELPIVGPAEIRFSPDIDGANSGFGIVGFEIVGRPEGGCKETHGKAVPPAGFRNGPPGPR